MPYIDVKLLFGEEDEYENDLSFCGMTFLDTDLSSEELSRQAETLIQSNDELSEMICELIDWKSRE